LSCWLVGCAWQHTIDADCPAILATELSLGVFNLIEVIQVSAVGGQYHSRANG
jgi:hypothetical protein